ncbi:hypothetical protein ABBQ32_006490 [Trebouxia sp. C0010 RCD-2024]
MATPPPTTFDHIVDVLTGAAPAPHTKFLSLRCPLTPQQVDQLAGVLETSSLQGGLRLKGCLLGNIGATVVAKALNHNTKLETLELPGNQIGAQGASMLLACLAHNTVLTTLDLEDNPCWEEASGTMEEIDAAISRNRALASSPCPGTPTPGRDDAPAPASHSVPALHLSSMKAGSARHALQSSGKENSLCTSTGGAGRVSADRMVDLLQRSTLQELGSFQGQMVTVGQTLTDKLVSLRHDWGGLIEDIARLKTAMSEGADRIREEAEIGAQIAAQQVRSDCKGALDEVWDNVEALEASHTSLASRVEGVEDDLRHVEDDLRIVEEDLRVMHDHTDKLDTYVNDMLKEMLGTLNQGQEHLKWDVQQLTSTVQQLQEKPQQGRAVDALQGRRQPALPCTPGRTPLKFMEDVVRRLTKLESAMVQATESVENESLRFEQSQLTTESMLAQQRTCQVEAAEQAKKTASQAEAHAALQQQVQQQAAAIAALQIQLASVTTQADASASPPRQQAADASNAGTGVDENTVSGKQGGVAWRTRCFTVRWSGGSHRFL